MKGLLWREEWTFLVLVVGVSLAVFMALGGFLEMGAAREQEFACVSLGYDRYDKIYDACASGEDPIVMRPYASVLEGCE